MKPSATLVVTFLVAALVLGLKQKPGESPTKSSESNNVKVQESVFAKPFVPNDRVLEANTLDGDGRTSTGDVFQVEHSEGEDPGKVNDSNCSTKKVIWDTDMDSDIDDAAALAILHHFADLGEVEILATISGSPIDYSVELVDVINTYYGRPDIPTGITQFGEGNSWILQGSQENWIQDMTQVT